jgi:acid phosphatase type 7
MPENFTGFAGRRWQGLLWAVALLAALVPAATTRAAVSKTPYLQNMSASGVTILFEATDEAAGAVRFGTAALDQKADFQMIQKIDPSAPKSLWSSSPPPVYLYRVHLDGLKPDTEYRYEVSHGAAALAAKTFHTFPDKPVPVTFIAYGDSRSDPKAHREVAANFIAHKPLFILHSGDMTGDEKDYSLWDREFFGPLADVIDHIPLVPVRGNHEGSGKDLHKIFEMGDKTGWFSLDCGPVHVAMLDNYNQDQAQLDWLEKDLSAAKAPWKIVVYHEPTFDLGGHKSAAGRTTILPILERQGVDIVLAGHSHLYERFRPILPPAAAGGPGHPITFITSAGGGAPLMEAVQNPLLAKAASVYHYCVFTVDAETLKMQAMLTDGKELDSFSITKTGGKYDKAYLSGAVTMDEALKAAAVKGK